MIVINKDNFKIVKLRKDKAIDSLYNGSCIDKCVSYEDKLLNKFIFSESSQLDMKYASIIKRLFDMCFPENLKLAREILKDSDILLNNNIIDKINNEILTIAILNGTEVFSIFDKFLCSFDFGKSYDIFELNGAIEIYDSIEIIKIS